MEWSCYIIENNGYTYVGVSNNVEKRLRAHNGEIKGGAKYTTSKGPGWKHICLIHGFPTKIESMQFEWALKHIKPRNAGGIVNRIKKLNTLLNKTKWTSKAPYAATCPLTLEWVDKQYRPEEYNIPKYVKEL
jgi:predicted GIY-YIG superfamily endonuclease|tara:strand:+ start:788 stop:1183 length:396 start_codon:yes stop_codon:yes gene_type:complete